MLLTYGIRSLDPDHAIFIIQLRQAQNKYTQFCGFITFWRYIYISFFLRQKVKESRNKTNLRSSYYFGMMLEGSGSGTISGSTPD